MKQILTINPDGSVESFGNPIEIEGVTLVSTKRFSTITPTNPFLWLAFKALRGLFGDNGIAAIWTRQWRGCEWECRILDTGETKRSMIREELVEWEQGMYESQESIIDNL